MSGVPSCRNCGERRWYALRSESVVSESDLDGSTGAFGEEVQIDGELVDMEMLCRRCGRESDGAALTVLEELYYA